MSCLFSLFLSLSLSSAVAFYFSFSLFTCFFFRSLFLFLACSFSFFLFIFWCSKFPMIPLASSLSFTFFIYLSTFCALSLFLSHSIIFSLFLCISLAPSFLQVLSFHLLPTPFFLKSYSLTFPVLCLFFSLFFLFPLQFLLFLFIHFTQCRDELLYLEATMLKDIIFLSLSRSLSLSLSSQHTNFFLFFFYISFFTFPLAQQSFLFYFT
ncbi:unnamed protein product [Acanthosepion pharaonis]|uniref:Uncharacterized protein n=1 Tax=Acanthosepion pharaonis TaxID=158019 RepID=A0A812CSF5_ACAPH|nr:unnamed protein product [Sepia pharaonis]